MSENEKNQAGKIKLLLVDDEKGFADVIAKRMSKRDIDVTKAYSGTEALQAIRKADFDVAVLDLTEEAAKNGIKFGAFDYLTKPCDLEELLAKVRAAYQQRKRT
jgi:DNA-binding response OmpR family regulator